MDLTLEENIIVYHVCFIASINLNAKSEQHYDKKQKQGLLYTEGHLH